MDKYDWEEEFKRLQEGESSLVRENARPLHFTKKQGEYTIEDRENFPEDFRCELIDGVIYDMAAPGSMHQLIGFKVQKRIDDYIVKNHGHCIVGNAPFDLFLSRDDRKTVLQPDVFVICERSQIVKKGVVGAPDMVIEILSPSTKAKDRGIKLQKYMQAGVRECWLVDLERKRVYIYAQSAGETTEAILSMPTTYTFDDTIPVSIFDGDCQIDMTEVYREVTFLDEMED